MTLILRRRRATTAEPEPTEQPQPEPADESEQLTGDQIANAHRLLTADHKTMPAEHYEQLRDVTDNALAAYLQEGRNR